MLSLVLHAALLLQKMEPATYFIDPISGSDLRDGSSSGQAWRSLERVSPQLRSGDTILVRAKSTLRGHISLENLKGITITSYGKGEATLDGYAGSAITLSNCKDARIERLNVVGAGRLKNDGVGIAVVDCQETTVADVKVSGFRLGGVEIRGGANVRLERVTAQENGAAGIQISSVERRARNIVITDCRALNNPGDPKNLTNHSGNGIVVGGVDGCEIAYCEAANNGWDMPRQGNGPVGIWAWNASRITIHHCISHHNKSPGMDGGGFDFDGGVTDSVMHHNLSFSNAGAGYLLCQFEGASLWKGNTIRDNVSFEDGSQNTQSGIALYLPDGMVNMSDFLVEHNVIVNSKLAVSTIGDVPGGTYRRNVFISGGEIFKLSWKSGGFFNSKIERNLAWGLGLAAPILGNDSPLQTPSAWRASLGTVADPILRLPKSSTALPTDPRKLSRMEWFRPLPDSPCREREKLTLGVRWDD